jgi:hypothetical protein
MKLTKEISAVQFENVGGIKQTVGDRRRAHESSVRHTSEFVCFYEAALGRRTCGKLQAHGA